MVQVVAPPDWKDSGEPHNPETVFENSRPDSRWLEPQSGILRRSSAARTAVAQQATKPAQPAGDLEPPPAAASAARAKPPVSNRHPSSIAFCAAGAAAVALSALIIWWKVNTTRPVPIGGPAIAQASSAFNAAPAEPNEALTDEGLDEPLTVRGHLTEDVVPARESPVATSTPAAEPASNAVLIESQTAAAEASDLGWDPYQAIDSLAAYDLPPSLLDNPVPSGSPDAPQQPAAAEIDVYARLADWLPAIDFEKIELQQFVRFLSELSTIPMTFEAESVSRAGIRLDDPIAVHFKDASLGQVLERVLLPRGLVYVVSGEQLIIVAPSRADAALRYLRYDFSDLVSDSPNDALDFSYVLYKLIQPHSWIENGGQGNILLDSQSVTICQSESVHRQVFDFGDRLRLARGLPMHGRQAAAPVTVTRFESARNHLSRPVSAGFVGRTRLVKIVEHLQKAATVQLVVDWASLHAAGLPADCEAQLVADRLPLGVALNRMLRPVGLTYRVVDSGVLEITTPQTLSQQLDLEFYPVGDVVSARFTPQDMTAALCERLAPDRWSEHGGAGQIHYDAPGACLIVLQSQDVQVRLERALIAWRAAARAASNAAIPARGRRG